ncbi:MULTISPECIES: hypothetical protein [Okeania]|uniref:Uncharacterized protein n=1 Tax=Okeania hirsuta TaxID=1458930 RepID=A0A3N6PL64_9CYAN|nr:MULTISPECIES: hypothetical protein [Okeania]NEP05312.1 hypothetical protein [Okeania sp. SIO4D6]NEP42570.1 hypothetical protein [Okeania sp. SIO2H7]NET14053.1 hypothetical protein [Okeania sp. SIO1H6]NEP73302.1 hypothetical protein [Okeania sp. SIO2G5]NEP91674.1 hypothetical protein [Okeania sp. SIO2F5]
MSGLITVVNTLITNLEAIPSFQIFISNLVTGEITILTAIFWLGVASGISIIAGAIGGIWLAGKDLGYSLAAMIGGLFGPAGVIPAVIVGLAILKFV